MERIEGRDGGGGEVGPGGGMDEGEEGRVRRVRRPGRAVGRFCVMVLVPDVIIICHAW